MTDVHTVFGSARTAFAFQGRPAHLTLSAWLQRANGDSFELLYWSLWKNRWTSTGPFGRTVLSIEDALQFIAYEDIFWVMT